jgi:hypothetical protein
MRLAALLLLALLSGCFLVPDNIIPYMAPAPSASPTP